MSGLEPISGVVAEGNRLKSLQALRDRLAVEIDTCDSSRDVATLSQRLADVLAQIDAVEKMQPEAKGSPRDEVARKRAQRSAASKAPRRSTRR